jgi:phosphoglycolate phosphatase
MTTNLDAAHLLSSTKLVVFDWDGTLLDSTAAITSSIQEAASDLGLPVPSRRAASQVIGLALERALKIAVPQVNAVQLPLLIERYRHHYLKRDAGLHPFQGIPELIDALLALNIPLAIATGKSHIGLMRAVDNLQWRGKFVTTRCADQGEPKPHPWMLLDICQELGIAPENALMIGDTTHDLGLAKNAGVPSVAVTYGAHSDEKFAEFQPIAVFSEVSQLGAWLLKGLNKELHSEDKQNAVALSGDLEERSYGVRFTMPDGRQAFAIRFDNEVRGYINECRHLPTELDWNFGHFLDADKEFLVCATHGALYDPVTGVCVAGPCRGKALEKVALSEHDGTIVLKDEF